MTMPSQAETEAGQQGQLQANACVATPYNVPHRICQQAPTVPICNGALTAACNWYATGVTVVTGAIQVHCYDERRGASANYSTELSAACEHHCEHSKALQGGSICGTLGVARSTAHPSCACT